MTNSDAVIKRFRVPIFRRFNDLDPLRHINNVTYLDYMQDARVGFLRSTSEPFNLDLPQVVARNEIDYKRPIGYGPEPIHVEIVVIEVKRASYVLRYDVFDEHENLCAVGKSVMVFVDRETGRPTPIPDRIRALLIERLVED